MKDINYYRRINGTYGAKNKRDVNIKKTQSALFKNILEHPNCQEVKFNNETEKDYAVIITDKNDNKFLIRQPNKKIKRGDLIEWNSNVWLCLSIDEDETIYSKGVIQRCNHNLKWIDSSDNLIIKPCIVSAQTLYTTGVKDEKVIEIPNGMIGVQLPYDKDTKKLDREASFVFNKTKYKITFYNEVEYEGLLVLICSEISTSHLDDKVNEIANRWIDVSGEKIDRLPWLDNQEPPEQPTEPQEPQNITYELEIIPQYQNEDGTEIYYGEWCKYAIHKFTDGQEVDGDFTFEIETLNNPQNIELATLEVENNICKVIVNNNAIMGGSIKLVTTDTETGQIAIEKEIEIMGM
jgi:hypothetical protein